MSIRTERIAEQLRQEISVILRDEITDPRVEMCSITRIKLSRDLSHAQVYWSPIMVDSVDIEAMEEALVSASGYVRRLIAQRLRLRHTPAFDFRFDPSIGEGDRMLSLLKNVRDDDAEIQAGREELDENEAQSAEEGGSDAAGEEDDGSTT